MAALVCDPLAERSKREAFLILASVREEGSGLSAEEKRGREERRIEKRDGVILYLWIPFPPLPHCLVVLLGALPSTLLLFP